MDAEKNLPTLIGKLKIDWLDFPVDDILQQFTTLRKEFSVAYLSKKQLVRSPLAQAAVSAQNPCGERHKCA